MEQPKLWGVAKHVAGVVSVYVCARVRACACVCVHAVCACGVRVQGLELQHVIINNRTHQPRHAHDHPTHAAHQINLSFDMLHTRTRVF
jgi:hypothetical protein